jgi:hypothetical protein
MDLHESVADLQERGSSYNAKGHDREYQKTLNVKPTRG